MTATSTKSTKATTMEELLKRSKMPFTPLHKGDTITGVITKLTPSEMLMDINYKTEALVIEKEKRLLKNLLALIKEGDTVTARVVSAESRDGFPVLTLRHYVEDKAWEKLAEIQKKQEKIAVIVREATRGGFLVETEDGIVGFLPNSHIGSSQTQEEMVGKEMKVGILELNRESKKILFSQKSVISVEDFHNAIKELKIGDKIVAAVSSITPFGIFAAIPQKTKEKDIEAYVDGLVHISEISWEKTPSDLATLFGIGQEIEAVIVSFDDNTKRVDLSIKRLTSDPFEEAIKDLTVDQKLTGIVTDVNDSGVSVSLPASNDFSLEGTIRKDKIPPTITFEKGKKVTVTISQIDTKKRKILLVPVLLEKPIGYR